MGEIREPMNIVEPDDRSMRRDAHCPLTDGKKDIEIDVGSRNDHGCIHENSLFNEGFEECAGFPYHGFPDKEQDPGVSTIDPFLYRLGDGCVGEAIEERVVGVKM